MTSTQPSAQQTQTAPETWVADERHALTLFSELMDATPDAQERSLANLSAAKPAVADRVRAMLVRHREATSGEFRQLAATLFRPLPAELGPFRIVGLIGEGGMGQVVRGVRMIDRGEQQVAIKLTYAPPGQHLLRERFLRERQLLARLRHPGIAPLIDFAETPDGLLWYAMPLIDGISIDQYVAKRDLDAANIVSLITELCDVLRYAHALGVIHRDIKPHNVLVTDDGKLHLIDFGIAKALDEDSELSLPGSAPMTPRYASPEQRANATITIATDQWQVAALAYELLTRSRLDESTRDGPRTRKLSPMLSPDVAVVLTKALRDEPLERYESVAQLSSDLRAAIDGRAVQARMGERWYELRKFSRRYRWAVAAAAMVAAALGAAAWYSHLAAQRAREQARVAERSSALLSEIFLSDVQGLNLSQMTLGSFIANGVERVVAEDKLPEPVRMKLLDTLAERASEAGEHAAAEQGAREALRLAKVQMPLDRLATGNACALLVMVLLNAPSRVKHDAEVRSLLSEAGEHSLLSAVPSAREAALRILVTRAQAFHAAYQNDFETALKHAEAASVIAERWLADDPWAVAGARRTAAVMYSAAEDSKNATRVYQEIIDYAETKLAKHPTLAEFVQWERTELCSQLSIHDPASGMIACNENIALLEKADRMGSMLAVESITGLGRSLSRQGRPTEALQQHQRAEQVLIALEGEATVSLTMASIRRRIGQSLLQLDRAAEAVLPLEFVLSVVRLQLPSHAPEQNEVRAELAQALARSGEVQRAKLLHAQIKDPESMPKAALDRYREVQNMSEAALH